MNKIKSLLIAIAGLSLSLGAAIGVGLNNKEVKEAKGTDATTMHFAGSATDWASGAEAFTNNGSRWVLSRNIAANETFKFVADKDTVSPVWMGWGWGGEGSQGMAGSTLPDGCFTAENGNGSNIKCLVDGYYSISLALNVQEYGNLGYGISIERIQYTVTRYAVVDGVVDSANPLGADTVDGHSTYNVPSKPTHKDGMVFGGWYSDSRCRSPQDDFSSGTITDNTSIYAKYTTHGVWAGTVIVDLKSSGWAEAAANYAIYFWDETSYELKVEGWSSYVTGTAANITMLSVSYSLNFEPLKMIVVRYNSTVSQSDWNTGDKWENDNWGKTFDADFSNLITIKDYDDEYKKFNFVINSYAKLEGRSGAEGAWGDLGIELNQIKLNGSNHTEYYSNSVTLAADIRFKVVQAGGYYNSYSTHASIAANFEDDKTNDHNIRVKVAGTYSFFFDSAAGTFYITTEALAAADEWAQEFLGIKASSNNCSYTKTHWDDLADSYDDLAPAVKAIFTSIKSGGDENGTYAEHAVARYDLVETTYGKTAYDEFMGREAAGKLNPKATNTGGTVTIENQSNVSLLTVIGISAVSLVAVGGYFFFRKRKEY